MYTIIWEKDDTAKKYWSEAIAGYKKYGYPKIYILYNNLAILQEKNRQL
jgi:hypothetical protein